MSMRIKYKCERCKHPVLMDVAYCEIDNESTEDNATVFFEDVYDNGVRVDLTGVSLSTAKDLQDSLFVRGFLDITRYEVKEINIDEEE